MKVNNRIISLSFLHEDLASSFRQRSAILNPPQSLYVPAHQVQVTIILNDRGCSESCNIDIKRKLGSGIRSTFVHSRWQITFNKHRDTLTRHHVQKRLKMLDDSVQLLALWMQEIDFVSLEWSRPLLFTANSLSVKTRQSWLGSLSRRIRIVGKNYADQIARRGLVFRSRGISRNACDDFVFEQRKPKRFV